MKEYFDYWPSTKDLDLREGSRILVFPGLRNKGVMLTNFLDPLESSYSFLYGFKVKKLKQSFIPAY